MVAAVTTGTLSERMITAAVRVASHHALEPQFPLMAVDRFIIPIAFLPSHGHLPGASALGLFFKLFGLEVMRFKPEVA